MLFLDSSRLLGKGLSIVVKRSSAIQSVKVDLAYVKVAL